MHYLISIFCSFLLHDLAIPGLTDADRPRGLTVSYSQSGGKDKLYLLLIPVLLLLSCFRTYSCFQSHYFGQHRHEQELTD